MTTLRSSAPHPASPPFLVSRFRIDHLLTKNLRYINSGYSKFGAITIEKVPESGRSSLSYRLFVDGVEAWNTTVLSPERTSAGNLWERFTGSR